MKEKLKKFSAFANEILPEEADYLMSVQQFEDEEKLDILKKTCAAARNQQKKPVFDQKIDKRKYSSLMQWIKQRLDAMDVDIYFEWVNDMDHKVITDAIVPAEERRLMQRIRNYAHPDYYFMKFYELVINYRHYLLIRLRYKEYTETHKFLESYKEHYALSKQVNEKLHLATVDIINHFNLEKTDLSEWEKWLHTVFFNEKLDGFNRYMAVVRLTFLYFNSREFDKLKDLYDELAKMLSNGMFYTRRILYNYYANRLMLHSKFDVLQQAEEYGYLSIRQKNADQVLYLSNLSSILIRRGKIEEALKLLKESFSEVQKSSNFYHKIGFISFYVKCLNMNNQPQTGELLAESFLRIYKEEILKQRWFSFFASYVQSLVKQQKFEKILQVYRRYNLQSKDKEDQKKEVYMPTIRWYYEIALMKEGRFTTNELVESILNFSHDFIVNPHKTFILNQVLEEISMYAPRAVTLARAKMYEKQR